MNSSLFSADINPRWFALILAVTLVVPAASAFFVNLYRDPFQIMSADTPGEAVFLGGHGESRFQHAAVVRRYQPRSIVIGNSLAANFLPTRIEQIFSWPRAYSLILPGATFHEQSIVARFALEHSQVEQALWLSSPVDLRLGPFVVNPKVYFPHYLYDGTRLNDLTVFATLPANLAPYVERKKVLRARLKSARNEKGERVDPRDYATAWHFLKNHQFNVPLKVEGMTIGAGRDGRDKYSELASELEPRLTSSEIDSLIIGPEDGFHRNFQMNVYALIKDNPSTQFTLVILPPLPRLYWQHMRLTDPAKYKLTLAYVREATSMLAKLDNVRVYAFGREKLMDNLRLYRDETHYHIAVNDYMLTRIANGKTRLTSKNVSKYLSAFDAGIRNYRLEKRWPRLKYNEELLRRGELTMEQAKYLVEQP